MLVERLTDFLEKEEIISDEEKEIVQFGLESLGGNLLGIILTLVVGVCFQQVREALLLWFLLFPLRKNAGGFHAKTKVRCFLSSTVTIIVSMVCIQQIRWTETENILITVISAVVIWIMAPVENGNKRLDSVEYRVYRQRTRKILLLEVLLFVLSLTFGWEDLVIVITMVFSIVCVVLVTGKVKMLKDRRRSRSSTAFSKEECLMI